LLSLPARRAEAGGRAKQPPPPPPPPPPPLPPRGRQPQSVPPDSVPLVPAATVTLFCGRTTRPVGSSQPSTTRLALPVSTMMPPRSWRGPPPEPPLLLPPSASDTVQWKPVRLAGTV
jgi:hypothetical protein